MNTSADSGEFQQPGAPLDARGSSSATSARLPLAGLRVLDLSRILAGPVCCQLLADLGADVVKVERPGAGDDTRQWGPPFEPQTGASAYYLSCNRGKRSLALDLAAPEARAVLDRLLARADVMVENFLPGSLVQLGLDVERVTQINPRLVRASISGYGRTGPLANEPGYDLAIQAGWGLMAITGEPDGAPMKVGVAMADVLTGLFAAASVLAGLVARERNGIAPAFDLALADCTLASLVNVAQATLVTGAAPKRWGNAHPQIVPYERFATADGHLVLAVGNDAQWQRLAVLCQSLDLDRGVAVGEAPLALDARYQTNPARVEHREELTARLAKVFRARTTAAWLTSLAEVDVPAAAVRGLDQALADPQTAARQMVQEVTDREGNRYRVLGSPVHWPGRPSDPPQAPPRLGEHTDEVLSEWCAMTREEIARLRIAKAIA